MLVSLSYSSTNVTSASYVTLVASTPVSCSNLLIVDSSTQLIKLAVGAAGAEVDICAFDGNGYPVNVPNLYVPAGSRLSLKAISSSATSGYNFVSLL